jgi:hypothetical protein
MKGDSLRSPLGLTRQEPRVYSRGDGIGLSFCEIGQLVTKNG